MQSNHLMGASFAKAVANFFTSDSVSAFHSNLELFHSSALCVMKVLSPLSAMGTMPEAAERVGLTSAETSLMGPNISLPSGFLSPFLPSRLRCTFHVSVATALTTSSLTEGNFDVQNLCFLSHERKNCFFYYYFCVISILESI
jgi:hypothetical protein